MRIDLNSAAAGHVSGEQDIKQGSANGTGKVAYAGPEDRTTLTSGSATLDSMVSTAMKSPEIRQDKVDSLRQAVNSGEYKLEPGKIAASILDEHA